MWGSFVEGEIKEASKDAKNTKEAETRVAQRLQFIFRDEADPEGEVATRPASSFADPARRFK